MSILEYFRRASPPEENVENVFEKTGLSLAIDGSEDKKMSFDDVDKMVMEQFMYLPKRLVGEYYSKFLESDL